MDEETKPPFPAPPVPPGTAPEPEPNGSSHILSLSVRACLALLLVLCLCSAVFFFRTDEKLRGDFVIIVSGAVSWYFGQNTKK